MTRTLRTLPWGIGSGTLTAGLLTLWMPWAWLLIVTGGGLLVAAGLFESLADSRDVGYDSTVFGKEAVAFDRIIQMGGID